MVFSFGYFGFDVYMDWGSFVFYVFLDDHEKAYILGVLSFLLGFSMVALMRVVRVS